MEEKRMRESGLDGLNSSELQTRGGTSLVDVLNCIEKIKTVLDFFGDYIPHLLRGIKKGWGTPVIN
ncbi:MAG: hypothetical protein WCQ46_00175 [Bacteroidales bacterium]